jgi:hypothetical protein
MLATPLNQLGSGPRLKEGIGQCISQKQEIRVLTRVGTKGLRRVVPVPSLY